MKGHFASFGAGSLFAIGLALSGMTKPSKVVGFLDVAGAWDASLAFVMLGAIAVHFVLQRVIRRRAAPIFNAEFSVPTRTKVDARLVLGSAIFGVGWGLGGFCPGPGLVSAAGGAAGSFVFVAGMTVGMLLEHGVARAMTRSSRDQQPAK